MLAKNVDIASGNAYWQNHNLKSNLEIFSEVENFHSFNPAICVDICESRNIHWHILRAKNCKQAIFPSLDK